MLKISIIISFLFFLQVDSFTQNRLTVEIPDTLHFSNNNNNSHQINLLQIENAKLESQIGIAIRTIDQQNSQLEQTNDLLTIFMALVGLMLIFFPLFSYFYYKKPIDEQKNEIKEIKKEAENILGDIKGALRSEIEKQNEELKIERFDNAIKALDDKYYQTLGIGIIEQICSTGITKYQQDKIIAYIASKINRPYDAKNHIPIPFIIKALSNILSKFGKSPKFDLLLSKLFKSEIPEKPLYLIISFPSFCEYIGKTADFSDVTLIEDFIELGLKLDLSNDGQSISILGGILRNLFEFNKITHFSIVDDTRFIEYLNKNKLIERLVNQYGAPSGKNNEIYKAFGLDFSSKFRQEIDKIVTN